MQISLDSETPRFLSKKAMAETQKDTQSSSAVETVLFHEPEHDTHNPGQVAGVGRKSMMTAKDLRVSDCQGSVFFPLTDRAWLISLL
jgi:hypothetical protein